VQSSGSLGLEDFFCLGIELHMQAAITLWQAFSRRACLLVSSAPAGGMDHLSVERRQAS